MTPGVQDDEASGCLERFGFDRMTQATYSFLIGAWPLEAEGRASMDVSGLALAAGLSDIFLCP